MQVHLHTILLSAGIIEFDEVTRQTGRAPLFVLSGPCVSQAGDQIMSAVVAEGMTTSSLMVEAQGNTLVQQIARLGTRIGR
jgi:hypothetical protein